MLLALHKTSELGLSQTYTILDTLGIVTKFDAKVTAEDITNDALSDAQARARCILDIADVVIMV